MATAAVVLAFGAGGFAIAKRGAGDDTVTACAKKRGGSLRAVSSPTKCKRKERLVQWNITGPQGPAGVQGAQGEPGPSHLYARHVSANMIFNTTIQTKGSYELPAGKYLIIGKLSAFNNDAQPSSLTCHLNTPLETLDTARTTIPARAGAAYYTLETISLAGVADLAAPTTVRLQCGMVDGATLDGIAQGEDLRIEALRVGDYTLTETFSGE